jgi:hypothetical protein
MNVVVKIVVGGLLVAVIVIAVAAWPLIKFFSNPDNYR